MRVLSALQAAVEHAAASGNAAQQIVPKTGRVTAWLGANLTLIAMVAGGVLLLWLLRAASRR